MTAQVLDGRIHAKLTPRELAYCVELLGRRADVATGDRSHPSPAAHVAVHAGGRMIRHIASVKNTHSVCVSAVRFEPIPWSHGWKVLDWQRGVYVPRLWDTERLAKRYASRRNNAHRAATAPRFVIGAGGAWMPVCEGLNQ